MQHQRQGFGDERSGLGIERRRRRRVRQPGKPKNGERQRYTSQKQKPERGAMVGKPGQSVGERGRLAEAGGQMGEKPGGG
jgi:hypothetical protein